MLELKLSPLEQAVRLFKLMLMPGVTEVFTVMVMLLLVAVEGTAHGSELLISQLMTSPLTRALLE
jgi:hypothetical protein